MRLLAGLLLAAGLAGGYAVPTRAATCDLNVTRAYEASVKRGWRFMCMKGVLHFDNRKRPGCAIKPVLPGAWEEARFMSNGAFADQANQGTLKNGWKIEYFEISGGQWSEKSSGRGSAASRVHFTFTAPMGKFTRRYLSKLVVSKPGGSCGAAYDEAF